MKRIMKIEGMMCGHCEARVKKTLEALSIVESAEVDHTEGTAIVEVQGAANDVDSILKNAVVEQGYEVISISEQ